MRCAWWSSRAPAARRSCPAPTSPSSRASAPPARRSSATTPSARPSIRASTNFPKPTIAQIQGYCIGGGLNLAIGCDLRFCTEGSRFGLPAAKLGLGYGYAGLKRFIDTVGPANTKDIFFSARQFGAAEALAMGVVNKVLPEGELAAFVKEYAATIAENAPLTIAAVKQAAVEASSPRASAT